jgi:hypothetical protein
MEHSLAMMDSEIKLFAGKWVELEMVVLSEINQAGKDYHMPSPKSSF